MTKAGWKTYGTSFFFGVALCALTACSSLPRLNLMAPFADDQLTLEDEMTICQSIADDLVAHFLQQQRVPPILIVWDIENRTGETIDTALMTAQIRREVNRSSRVRVVKETRRQEALAKYATPSDYATADAQRLIGMQLGARYLMTGRITGPAAGATKLQLDMEVIDLESGDTRWNTHREIAKPATGS